MSDLQLATKLLSAFEGYPPRSTHLSLTLEVIRSIRFEADFVASYVADEVLALEAIYGMQRH